MVLRALIVDDEKPARDELAYLLDAHPDIVATQADCADAALAAIEGDKPDIVLLDIRMPGQDGFEVLRQARDFAQVPLFIFVTAYDEYAIKAFEQNAVDYLLKPVAPERLAESLGRARRRLAAGRGPMAAALTSLLEGLGRGTRTARVAVERHGRIALLPTAEVLCLDADDKGIAALTDQGRFPCHGLPTLTKAEERLAGLPFFRANRAVMVNLERIAELSPWVGGKYLIVLDDADRTEVTVSRNRVREFKERLGL
ncbi:two component transcriptional regulator, LytTR family [Solidesulfovibrio fructosivorans JJ]]|uniref:Two component transcriptional regulator, LytTR family n=1 Tax=Solidesulfovibrio fructosivorans JJ] TaxID=596151 RepID=E1JUN5_SOLFR|nr:LytTR family DNA-binding domain-containing protein [Solidesulfovibrio fructosivorans]EFL51799.1 two component transcriptional regulator, LytTR family [Solidesulfovibrio fructosivorans JJ]]